ncbi:MAG: hypothetical protein EA406_07485 [Rhodospirillales bacterium]|nr:MAG: hypothetical protein EA406_07485 [Rhodospirillales bacterium]
MQHHYTYAAAASASEKVSWRIEDIIGGDKVLDYAKPFMPESLARTRGISFMTPSERRVLNQIRGHGYLYLFGTVEQFILPFVLDHARAQLDSDDERMRALLQFAGEEAKHIRLFKRFRREFQEGFGTTCDVIGPPDAIARFVLSHHPLAVALVILHIEWMTQRHYVDSVHDDTDLDTQFKSLLRHHWMEEAQHARLDTLMVEALAEGCDTPDVDRAMDDYLTIGGFLDQGLNQQVAFDLGSFVRATGRRMTDEEEAEFTTVQHQANRWTFLGSGMTHPNFLESVGAIREGARQKLEAAAPCFC